MKVSRIVLSAEDRKWYSNILVNAYREANAKISSLRIYAENYRVNVGATNKSKSTKGYHTIILPAVS